LSFWVFLLGLGDWVLVAVLVFFFKQQTAYEMIW